MMDVLKKSFNKNLFKVSLAKSWYLVAFLCSVRFFHDEIVAYLAPFVLEEGQLGNKIITDGLSLFVDVLLLILFFSETIKTYRLSRLQGQQKRFFVNNENLTKKNDELLCFLDFIEKNNIKTQDLFEGALQSLANEEKNQIEEKKSLDSKVESVGTYIQEVFSKLEEMKSNIQTYKVAEQDYTAIWMDEMSDGPLNRYREILDEVEELMVEMRTKVFIENISGSSSDGGRDQLSSIEKIIEERKCNIDQKIQEIGRGPWKLMTKWSECEGLRSTCLKEMDNWLSDLTALSQLLPRVFKRDKNDESLVAFSHGQKLLTQLKEITDKIHDYRILQGERSQTEKESDSVPLVGWTGMDEQLT